jgi:hypothetical protein
MITTTGGHADLRRLTMLFGALALVVAKVAVVAA